MSGHDDGLDEPTDPFAVVELLEDGGATFAEKVAAYLDPHLWLTAHTEDAEPQAVTTWVTWVATVARIGRGHAVIGHRASHDATTVHAVTEISEGDLLISLAEQYGHPDTAEQLRTWLNDLHATGPDGHPLVENPTGVSAVVLTLADRTTRRTS